MIPRAWWKWKCVHDLQVSVWIQTKLDSAGLILIIQLNLWMQEPLILLWKEWLKCAGRWQGMRRLLREGFFFYLPPPLWLALIRFMRVRRWKPHYLMLLDVNVCVIWLFARILIRELIKVEGGCQFLKRAFSLSAGKKAFINSLQNVLKRIQLNSVSKAAAFSLLSLSLPLMWAISGSLPKMAPINEICNKRIKQFGFESTSGLSGLKRSPDCKRVLPEFSKNGSVPGHTLWSEGGIWS